MSKHSQPDRRYPAVNDQQRLRYQAAVAAEMAAHSAHVDASKDARSELESRAAFGAALVAQLKAAREAAGVSLDELAARTGMPKSAVSRLENSANPNPTLATLRRYAEAIGKLVAVTFCDASTKSP